MIITNCSCLICCPLEPDKKELHAVRSRTYADARYYFDHFEALRQGAIAKSKVLVPIKFAYYNSSRVSKIKLILRQSAILLQTHTHTYSFEVHIHNIGVTCHISFAARRRGTHTKNDPYHSARYWRDVRGRDAAVRPG